MLKVIGKSLRVWWFELRTVLLSGRWVVLTMVSFMLMGFYLKPILQFAEVYDLKLCPAVFPHFFGDSVFSSLGMLLLIFMTSVFPITGHIQQGILMRSGNRCWVNGQFLTDITLVLLWLGEMLLFICAIIGGRLSFQGWGKVWGSFGGESARNLGFDSYADISMEIILGYTPLQAVLMSMLFVWLTGILFGEFIFCVDGLCRNYIGEILLAVWGFGNLLIASFGNLSEIGFLRMLSPVSWLDISRYIGNPVRVGRVLLVMGGLILLFYIFNRLLVRAKKIEIR
ncbi:MAG: hypothetical protein NC123_12965 [Butyrivibrio sp.]|nr:hypothetical protein [Acetatifactor muris]MCM1560431.1 hypothetical protein [Butyrivibrio sp.]